MKKLWLFLLIMCGTAAQETPVSRDHTAWIAASRRTMQTIKPGMTRTDLLTVFRAEGGLSNRVQQTYVFRECPYIKVDVRFKPVGQEENLLLEAPGDVIVTISRPYLNWSVAD